MHEPSSPFDDDAPDQPALVKRKRRPWWRWNIITLFAVLFVLVWVRYLLSLGPGATWTLVITVFMMWACAPLFFVSTVLTTIEDLDSAQPNRIREYATGQEPARLVAFLRRLAIVFMILSTCEFLVYCVLFATSQLSRGGWIWFQGLQVLSSPVTHFFLCAIVFLLADIARQRERVSRDGAFLSADIARQQERVSRDNADPR